MGPSAARNDSERPHSTLKMANWLKTTLRVTNLQSNIAFFTKHFGFTVLESSDERACLTILRPGETKPASAVEYKGQMIEFRQVTSNEALHNGNTAPFRGFGHIAVNCNDVYAECDKLIEAGVAFQKKPNDGRMKGLAFALSPEPENIWIEIVSRQDPDPSWPTFNLSQTMLRVRDPAASLAFYNKLGLKLVAERHFPADRGDFSLYFLADVEQGELDKLNEKFKDVDDEKYVNLDTDPLQVFDSLTFASKTEVEGEKDGKLVDPDGYVVNMVRRE